MSSFKKSDHNKDHKALDPRWPYICFKQQNKGRFRLEWRSVLVKNFGGMKQYDWLQMGCSPAEVNIMAKIFQVENFKHGCKNDMAANTFC